MRASYTSSDGVYTVTDTLPVPRQHAVRVLTYADRFLDLEEKFFCDKPTEKSVNVTVRILVLISLLENRSYSNG